MYHSLTAILCRHGLPEWGQATFPRPRGGLLMLCAAS